MKQKNNRINKKDALTYSQFENLDTGNRYVRLPKVYRIGRRKRLIEHIIQRFFHS